MAEITAPCPVSALLQTWSIAITPSYLHILSEDGQTSVSTGDRLRLLSSCLGQF